MDLERDAVQSLRTMIKKLGASLDQNETCVMFLTDLFKGFDWLPHDLLIAKLHAYGCNLIA